MAVTKHQLLDFYIDCLNSQEGQTAKNYLLSRSIGEQTIKDFRLGYCPSDWAGHPIWRRRVIFPIIDPYGSVVAFSGRLLTYMTKDANGNKAVGEMVTNKLIRSFLPDGKKQDYAMIQFHDAFPKNYYMYGVQQAKNHIREKGYAIIVEGQSDVLSMHSAGLRNTVGTCGSALTLFHLITLYRYCNTVILLFDADEGGQKALDLAMKRVMMNHYFLRLTDGYDPNSYIMKNGAQPIIDGINNIMESFNNSFQDKVLSKIELYDYSAGKVALKNESM